MKISMHQRVLQKDRNQNLDHHHTREDLIITSQVGRGLEVETEERKTIHQDLEDTKEVDLEIVNTRGDIPHVTDGEVVVEVKTDIRNVGEVEVEINTRQRSLDEVEVDTEVLIDIIKVLNDIVGVLVLTGSAGGVQRLPINHLPLKTT